MAQEGPPPGGDPWNYTAIGNAVSLGLDENHGHVQPTGKYHYHSHPTAYLKELKVSVDAHSPLSAGLLMDFLFTPSMATKTFRTLNLKSSQIPRVISLKKKIAPKPLPVQEENTMAPSAMIRNTSKAQAHLMSAMVA